MEFFSSPYVFVTIILLILTAVAIFVLGSKEIARSVKHAGMHQIKTMMAKETRGYLSFSKDWMISQLADPNKVCIYPGAGLQLLLPMFVERLDGCFTKCEYVGVDKQMRQVMLKLTNNINGKLHYAYMLVTCSRTPVKNIKGSPVSLNDRSIYQDEGYALIVHSFLMVHDDLEVLRDSFKESLVLMAADQSKVIIEYDVVRPEKSSFYYLSKTIMGGWELQSSTFPAAWNKQRVTEENMPILYPNISFRYKNLPKKFKAKNPFKLLETITINRGSEAFTGAIGSGKSTLMYNLAMKLSSMDNNVRIIFMSYEDLSTIRTSGFNWEIFRVKNNPDIINLIVVDQAEQAFSDNDTATFLLKLMDSQEAKEFNTSLLCSYNNQILYGNEVKEVKLRGDLYRPNRLSRVIIENPSGNEQLQALFDYLEANVPEGYIFNEEQFLEVSQADTPFSRPKSITLAEAFDCWIEKGEAELLDILHEEAEEVEDVEEVQEADKVSGTVELEVKNPPKKNNNNSKKTITKNGGFKRKPRGRN